MIRYHENIITMVRLLKYNNEVFDFKESNVGKVYNSIT